MKTQAEAIEEMRQILTQPRERQALYFTRYEGQCMHSRWCESWDTSPASHAELCPTRVLGMLDGDVRAFFDRYCHVKAHVNNDCCVTLVLVGEYDGRRATSSLSGGHDEKWRAIRWLAEELVLHQKLGTER